MVERLRALLERPLDPALSRVVLAVACALTVGFTALVALGIIGAEQSPSRSSTQTHDSPVGVTAPVWSNSSPKNRPAPAQTGSAGPPGQHGASASRA